MRFIIVYKDVFGKTNTINISSKVMFYEPKNTNGRYVLIKDINGNVIEYIDDSFALDFDEETIVTSYLTQHFGDNLISIFKIIL